MKKYKQITIEKGKIYTGYQQHFEILDVWQNEATLLTIAGDDHRVERGPIANIQRLLQMVVDEYQSYEDREKYFLEEYPDPKIRLVAAWPDDYQYDEFIQKHDVHYDVFIYDIETGEVYDEL